MSRNGSGVYNLPQSAFVYDTVIDETNVNSNFSDIADALTASISKDGQTTPTANLPMGGFKLTGLADGSAKTDSAALGQIQGGAGIWCGTAGGTANAITLSPTPAITAYAAGQRFEFKAGASANSGAVTFAISGLATIAGQVNGAACAGSEIAANQWYRITLSDASTAQIERLGEGINGPSIGSGKAPQWNGSAWVGVTPGSGTVTSIIAGTGLTGGTITTSGTIAVDVGTTASKIVQLDGSAKLPAVDGSQLTGISATDLTARDQIALANMRMLLTSSVASGALVQGYQWELASDEWGGTSTGKTYTAGTPNYYVPTAGGYSQYTATGSTFGDMVSGGGLAAAFNGGTNQTTAASAYHSGANTGYVGKAFSSGQVITKCVVYNSSDNGWSGSGGTSNVYIYGKNSSPANGADGTLLGSVTGMANTNSQSQAVAFANSTAYQYVWCYITNSATGSVIISQVLYYTTLASSNMTLVAPSSISVTSAPTFADVYCLYKDDSGSAVLGTDLTIEISRDGGTTYTASTVTTLASYDGTYSIIRGRANVSAQPSGTSLKSRIATLNTKSQRIAAPAIYSE